MKTVLRALLVFLDRKFPDKLTVTPAQYAALVAAQEQAKTDLEALRVKMGGLENQMLNVNMAMGFAVPKAALLER